MCAYLVSLCSNISSLVPYVDLWLWHSRISVQIHPSVFAFISKKCWWKKKNGQSLIRFSRGKLNWDHFVYSHLGTIRYNYWQECTYLSAFDSWEVCSTWIASHEEVQILTRSQDWLQYSGTLPITPSIFGHNVPEYWRCSFYISSLQQKVQVGSHKGLRSACAQASTQSFKSSMENFHPCSQDSNLAEHPAFDSFWDSVTVLCFAKPYFVSVLVLQSSWWGRESWLLCLVCLPGASWLLCGSSSQCYGFICSFWLWYFLIILTIF